VGRQLKQCLIIYEKKKKIPPKNIKKKKNSSTVNAQQNLKIRKILSETRLCFVSLHWHLYERRFAKLLERIESGIL
jgi:hypothetical protein